MHRKQCNKAPRTHHVYIPLQYETSSLNSDYHTEYEVEKILDKRFKNGKVQYKVKWKDYSLSESTWEPEENLEGSKELVKEFEKRFLQQKTNRFKIVQKPKLLSKLTKQDINLIDDSNSENMKYRHTKLIVLEDENEVNTETTFPKELNEENKSNYYSKEDEEEKTFESIKKNYVGSNNDNESTSKSGHASGVDVEVVEICDIFVLEKDLIARVICKILTNEHKVIEKTKMMTTQELGKIAPQKLLRYYEKKINFSKM